LQIALRIDEDFPVNRQSLPTKSPREKVVAIPA
jgi:hypothetical protein